MSVTFKKGLLGLIPTILSDLVLVIIMLVGLIILSRNGSSSFGLTPLIIKQVWWQFLLAVVSSNGI